MLITTTTASAVRSACASRTKVQKLITKYGLAAHLALLAVAPLFLSPTGVIVLSVLVASWLLLEPSRIGNEMLHDARRRVGGEIVRDPIFWMMIVLTVMSLIRVFNDGVKLAYDSEIAKWYVSLPAMPYMPGSVEGAGLPLFSGVLALSVLLQGCRHALGRSARFAMGLIVCFLVGVWSFTQTCGELEVAAMVSPAFTGVASALALVISLPVLSAVFERRWWMALPLIMIGIAGSAAGTFLLNPPIVTALYLSALVVVGLYNFVYLRIQLSKLADFRHLVVFALSLAFAAAFVIYVLPEQELTSRVDALLAGDFLPENYMKLRGVLSDVCLRIWKKAPWLGTGLGSFAIDLRFHANAFEWSTISPMQSAPLNGYWLLLVERGVVGAFVMAITGLMLLITFVHHFASSIRRIPHPLCLAGFVLVILAGVESWGDCSFMMIENLLLLVTFFTLSANAFSKGE